MALFAYRAIDEDGKMSSGNLDAVNGVDLELRLRRLGLDLITFDSVKRSVAKRTRSVTRQELITFCFHLSQLLRAAPLHPVIVTAELDAVQPEAMDNAGFTIGDHERLRVRIEGEAAERRTGIGLAVERDIREQADGAG